MGDKFNGTSPQAEDIQEEKEKKLTDELTTFAEVGTFKNHTQV